LDALAEQAQLLSNFTGKVVPVTRGRTGIGCDTPLAFARQGATYVIGERARR
jgi:hypothetical protein